MARKIRPAEAGSRRDRDRSRSPFTLAPLALALAASCAGTDEVASLDAPPPPPILAAPAGPPGLEQLFARSEARWRSLQRGEYAETIDSFLPQRWSGDLIVLSEDEDAMFLLHGPGLVPRSLVDSHADDRAVLRSSFGPLPRGGASIPGRSCVLYLPDLHPPEAPRELEALEEWQRVDGEWYLRTVRVARQRR